MALVDVLKERSTWTYNMMGYSAELGEMIREDALTSVNISMIQYESTNQGLGLSTTSLQGSNLEKEFGGDWIWNYNNKTFVIQAKRLDAIKKAGLVSYKIDIPQLQTLIEATAGPSFSGTNAEAYYVFYNTYLPGNPEDLGCIMIEADSLWRAIAGSGKGGQATVTMKPEHLQQLGAKSWWIYFSN
ncbi:MAG: hypothetical protein ABJL55_17335 [Roseibium sp.]